MPTAESCMKELIKLAADPAFDPHVLGVSTRDDYVRRNNLPGIPWRGLVSGGYAFSAIVEACCETVESSGTSAVQMAELIASAEKTGKFSITVKCHTFSLSGEAMGQDSRMKSKKVEPVVIVVERLNYLGPYEVIRLV